MNTPLLKRETFISFLILAGLISLILVPAVSASGMSVDLDKAYQYRGMNVTSIEAIDLADPAVSKVTVLATAEDGKDIKAIKVPAFRNLDRSVTKTEATYRGNEVHIDLPARVDISGAPTTYYVYTRLNVPTFRVNVPGQSGNPLLMKYNNSLENEDLNADNIFRAVDDVYMYVSNGIIYSDISTGEVSVSGSGISSSDYDADDLGFTLTNNEIPLADFSVDAGKSRGLTLKSTTGKYGLGVVNYDASSHTLRLLAAAPVVILDGNNQLTWNGDKTTPDIYYQKTGNGVRVSVRNTAGADKYVTGLLRKDKTYDLSMRIDADKLAEKAGSIDASWNEFGKSSTLIDFLMSLADNGQSGISYTLSCEGKPICVDGSVPADSPGYGVWSCDGQDFSADIMKKLSTGNYYAYVMALNGEGDVIALDQREVEIKASKPSSGSSGGGGHSGSTISPTDPDTPQTGVTSGASLDITGASFSENAEGTQTISLNLKEAGKDVTVSGDRILIKKPGMSIVIITDGITTTDGVVSGNIQSVRITCTPLNAEFAESGNIQAGFEADLDSFPSDASVTTTLDETVSEDASSAFSLAASGNGLDITGVAYVMSVMKTGFDQTGPATITMSVSQEWVDEHGGNGAVRIIRQADDGSSEVLETKFAGYDENHNLIFEAQSPNGLCIFGLVSVTAAAATPEETLTTAPTSQAEDKQPVDEGGLPLTLIALLIVIIAVAGGYYLMKRE